MLALAWKDVIGDGDTSETVEAVFAQAHRHSTDGNEAKVGMDTGNGHRGEAPEPQQSLFSWAEFLAEEPVKPKSRGRKAQPATLSLFDWALTLGQEWEEELVGAGR